MVKPHIRLKNQSQAETSLATSETTPRTYAFSFGDPESVLSMNPADYMGVFAGPGEYYEPPVSLRGLGKILHANGYHGAIPPFRRNRLLQYYESNNVLSDEDLGNASVEYDVFGNCYLQKIYNRFNQVIAFKHLPALMMRKMKKADTYCQLRSNGNDPIVFKPGEVVHLKEYDVNQSIYGIPQYYGGINAVLLGEEATLFRRKYYVNGAHMGYILYTSDSSLDAKDEEAIKKAVSESKGVGNFRSMYLNIPKGNKDSVQLIRVGDIATKDEYDRIKSITRAEILAMWRIQASLAGVMPDNPGGFGDIEKIAKVYFQYETVPMQDNFMQLNKHLAPGFKLKFGKPQEGEY